MVVSICDAEGPKLTELAMPRQWPAVITVRREITVPVQPLPTSTTYLCVKSFVPPMIDSVAGRVSPSDGGGAFAQAAASRDTKGNEERGRRIERDCTEK